VKKEPLGIRLSDTISKFVGTWTFIFLYTLSMVIWIGLHLLGILHIDSADFIKWNLWLSYFAGTQASIVLMSSERQAQIDRKKIRHILLQVNMLEEILEDFIIEQEEPHATDKGHQKKTNK